MRKSVKSARFTVRFNFEKELKSTVWGREFQQFAHHSLQKSARTQFVVWRLKSLNLCRRVRTDRG